MDNSQKTYDCIEEKRQAQETIYDEIKDLTPEEEIAYFRISVKKSQLGEWWEAVCESRKSPQTD